MMKNCLRLGIIAGELSGDNLGANLIKALGAHYQQLDICGIAGPKMIAAGANSLFPMDKLSVMGIFEPIRHIPELLRIRKYCYQYFIDQQIDVFIGIDSPDFNLGLEVALRQAGIKVVHYVSPSVWAWRRWRWRKIARAVDLMLTLYPFEADFYQQYNIPACYVGHPLADQIPLNNDQQIARQQLGLTKRKKIIALLPGSRLGELKHLSRVFIETASACQADLPELHFITAMAKPACRNYFNEQLRRFAPELSITLFDGQARAVMSAADVVLVASGTATLECALLKRPMVVSYKVSQFTAWIALCLVKVKYCSLPNLLANRELVPELLQDAATVEKLVPALKALLNSDNQAMINEFNSIHQRLKCDASTQAAAAIAKLVDSVAVPEVS